MTPRDATPGRTPTGSTPRPGGLRARTGHRIQQGAAPQPSQVADNGGMAGTEKPAGGRRRARELNELIRYTMWSVFRVRNATALDAGRTDRAALAGELEGLLDQAAGKGVTTRGCYDVQGLRADADYMFWWIAPSPDDLQELYARFRRTRLGRASEPPRAYVSVYPFVRSYEWYLLDPAERRDMLAEHGMMAREYPDVRANTVSCFSLNDFEWILAFEADELHRIVDLMRHLRGARARLHTRLEIPFYTGRRKPPAELIASLP